MAELESIGKTPPHNREAEIAVLGGVLLDSEALAKVVELLNSHSFYYPAHSQLFEQARTMFEKGQPVDLLSLSDSLQQEGLLDSVGGTSYLLDLVNSIPTTANIEYYARIVERDDLLRRLIRAGTEIVQMSYHGDNEDISTILNKAEQKVFEIGHRHLGKNLEHIRPVLWNLFEQLEETYNTGDLHENRLVSGFSDFDKYLGGGMNPSDLIILAARPSMGKTSLALNIGITVAVECKRPVAVFSLEMSKEQLVTRMFCAEAGMNSRALKSGTLHTDEWERLSSTIARLSEAPVYIDDSSAVTPSEIRSKCRRLKAEQKDLGLIIVDYLQLMDTGSDANRVQELSRISRSMKQLARELDVPVMALSQLNRAVESRQNKRPMLSDLRESGAIEQDADIVLFLYRDEYYQPDSKDKNIAELIIAKHRNGPTGTVKLYFDPALTKFANLSLD